MLSGAPLSARYNARRVSAQLLSELPAVGARPAAPDDNPDATERPHVYAPPPRGADARTCRISRDHCAGWPGRRLRLSPPSCRRSEQVGRGPLSRGQAGSAAVQADSRVPSPGQARWCSRIVFAAVGGEEAPDGIACRPELPCAVTPPECSAALGHVVAAGPAARSSRPAGVGWPGYAHWSHCPAVLGRRRRAEPTRVIREREEYTGEGGEVLT
jgi:hypothetical protein